MRQEKPRQQAPLPGTKGPETMLRRLELRQRSRPVPRGLLAAKEMETVMAMVMVMQTVTGMEKLEMVMVMGMGMVLQTRRSRMRTRWLV